MTKPDVVIPPAGRHGGDAERVATALGVDVAAILDLSASLNPLAPSVAHVVRRHADSAIRYPDPTRARASLAEAIGVADDWILLTNGGAEAIALVAAEIGGWVVEPEFALHPRGASGPRWRSNPNNPTGVLAAQGEVADVWDEAFYPLATGAWTRGDAGSGALVVGSLTKVFACPGLRLGYVIAQPDVIEHLARRQPQ
jgi:histidinol-phosphate/aromatic aminotransferase/cobyric acid decarboxylase-like protein